MGIRSWIAAWIERPYWLEVRKRAWADTWALIAPAWSWYRVVPPGIAALFGLAIYRPAFVMADWLITTAIFLGSWAVIVCGIFLFQMNMAPARLARQASTRLKEREDEAAAREKQLRDDHAAHDEQVQRGNALREAQISAAAAEREKQLTAERDAALERVRGFEDKLPEFYGRLYWRPSKLNPSWIQEGSDGWRLARLEMEIACENGTTRLCLLTILNDKPGAIARGVHAQVEIKDQRNHSAFVKKAVWLAEDTPGLGIVDLTESDRIDIPHGVERTLALLIAHGDLEDGGPIYYALDAFSRTGIRWERVGLRLTGPQLRIIVTLYTEDTRHFLHVKSDGYQLTKVASDMPVQTYN